MCEDKDCGRHDKKHHRKHYGDHYKHHGYRSIVKRDSKDVLVPEVLLKVGDIKEGDFLEISVKNIVITKNKILSYLFYLYFLYNYQVIILISLFKSNLAMEGYTEFTGHRR